MMMKVYDPKICLEKKRKKRRLVFLLGVQAVIFSLKYEVPSNFALSTLLPTFAFHLIV